MVNITYTVIYPDCIISFISRVAAISDLYTKGYIGDRSSNLFENQQKYAILLEKQ